jgi:Bacterial protein of unknown function (DUF899)
MDWKFCWVSSNKSDFNYDFHVSFRPEEAVAGKTIYNFREKEIDPETFTLSGHSVFYKNEQGEIFRTYGTFGRGSEQFMGIYGFFDVFPKGREVKRSVGSLPISRLIVTAGMYIETVTLENCDIRNQVDQNMRVGEANRTCSISTQSGIRTHRVWQNALPGNEVARRLGNGLPQDLRNIPGSTEEGPRRLLVFELTTGEALSYTFFFNTCGASMARYALSVQNVNTR